MARGYPDFFGHSMFPYYGVMTEVGAATAVAGGATAEIGRITGKGSVFSVDIYTIDTDADVLDRIRIYCDNGLFTNQSWAGMYVYGFDKPVYGEMFELCYDPNTPRFRAIMPGQIPFGINLYVTYQVTGVNPVTVSCYIDYTYYV